MGRHPRGDRRTHPQHRNRLIDQKIRREKHAVIPFDMVEPTSLKEAISLLDPQEPTIRPVAGGTALMLMMKAGVFQPSLLVCLHKIEPEHSRIVVTGGALRI